MISSVIFWTVAILITWMIIPLLYSAYDRRKAEEQAAAIARAEEAHREAAKCAAAEKAACEAREREAEKARKAAEKAARAAAAQAKREAAEKAAADRYALKAARLRELAELEERRAAAARELAASRASARVDPVAPAAPVADLAPVLSAPRPAAPADAPEEAAPAASAEKTGPEAPQDARGEIVNDHQSSVDNTSSSPSALSLSGFAAAHARPPFAGEIVAFTGTLPAMTRAQAIAATVQRGGRGQEHISADCTLLVIGEEPGRGQQERAERWRVPCITWEEWYSRAGISWRRRLVGQQLAAEARAV